METEQVCTPCLDVRADLSLPVLRICKSCGMSDAGKFSICASLGRMATSICLCPFSPELVSSPMKRSSSMYVLGCTAYR